MMKIFKRPSNVGYWSDASYFQYIISNDNKIYQPHSWSRNHILPSYLLFDDINQFQQTVNFITNPTLGSINPTGQEKIYVSPQSNIPSILFSKILRTYDISEVKRCVKKDSADLICLDTEEVLNGFDFGYYAQRPGDFVIFAVPAGDKPTNTNIACSEKYTKKSLETTEWLREKTKSLNRSGYDVYYALAYNSANVESAYDLIKNSNKYISDYTLIKYLWSKMTPLPEEAVSTFCSEIKSSDLGAVSSAIDSICMFNWEDYMFDLYKALVQNYNYMYSTTQSALNKKEQFFFFCMHEDINHLRRIYRRGDNNAWVDLSLLMKSKGRSDVLGIFKSPLYKPIPYEKMRAEVKNILEVDLATDYSLNAKLNTIHMKPVVYYLEDSPGQTVYELSFVNKSINDIKGWLNKQTTYKEAIDSYKLDILLEVVNDQE